MTTCTFTLPRTNTTKAEETEILTHIVDSLKSTASGSFLASLLTPELLKWAAMKIKDDTCPDIYSFYLSAEAHLNEKESEIRRMVTQAAIAAATANTDIHRLEEKVEFLQDQLNRFNDTAANLREKILLKERELNDSFEVQRKMEVEADALKQTIIELKAKLYDITMAGK